MFQVTLLNGWQEMKTKCLVLMVAIVVFSYCCAKEVPINIKTSPPKTHDYDGFEVKSNYHSASDIKFKIEIEEYAARQIWERYEIRWGIVQRLRGKHIGFAVIYYWELKGGNHASRNN